MVMVPPVGRSVCVVKATVVTAVVACSAFWSAAASVSTGDCTVPTRAGAAAPALAPSAEVRTVRPVLLLATPGPVVSSPAAKVIFEAPTGKSAVAVVHTMVSVPAVNVQVAVRAAAPDTGTRVAAGLDLALK